MIIEFLKRIDKTSNNIQLLYDDSIIQKWEYSPWIKNKYIKAVSNLLNDVDYQDFNFIICHTYEHMGFDDNILDIIITLKNLFNEKNRLPKLQLIDNNINKIFIEEFDYDIIKDIYYPSALMIGEFHEYINKTPEQIFNKKISSVFNKNFLSFNGYPKHHRRELVNFLTHSGISEKTYLSYNTSNVNKSEPVLHIEGDKFKSNIHQNKNISHFHYDSFCNIVTESKFIYNNQFHLTEKTDKCFVTMQPFIMVSCSNYLKTLKKLGFKTFDKWWDESYDDENDNNKRLEKIYKVIEDVSKWDNKKMIKVYSEMEDVLFTNFKLSKALWYGENKKYWFPKSENIKNKWEVFYVDI